MNAELDAAERIRMAHYGQLGLHPNTDSRTFCNREGCACGLPSQDELRSKLNAEAQARLGLEEVKAALGKATVMPGVVVTPNEDGDIVIPKDGWYRITAGKLDPMDNGGYRLDSPGEVVSAQDEINRVLGEATALADRYHERLKRQGERIDELVKRQSCMETLCKEVIGMLTAHEADAGYVFLRQLEAIIGGGEGGSERNTGEAQPAPDGG